MRLTFPYDWLLDQVLEGRKTASVLRPGERNYGTDAGDGEVRVGGEYDACDTRGRVRCRIRVTEMRELRWGEPIPERLWRAEACASEAEFRRDHVEWFSNPGAEYTFRAFWFERIAGVLVALALTAVLACAPPAVRAATDPLGASAPATTPAVRLANERDVLEAIMRPMLETGTVADGTVFAGVRLRADGTVAEILDVHGGVHAASPQIATLLREATSRARFTAGSGALPSAWAVFWVFQTDACRPWTYDTPPGATVIRVCLDVEAGAVRASGSYYLVDALPRAPHADPCSQSPFGRVVPYPSRARAARRTGVVHARYTVDAAGKLVGTEILRADDPDFRGWELQWRRTWQPEVLARCAPSSGTRAFEIRAAFELARPGAGECIFVLPGLPDLTVDVRICGSRRAAP